MLRHDNCYIALLHFLAWLLVSLLITLAAMHNSYTAKGYIAVLLFKSGSFFFPGILRRSWLPTGIDEAFLENCHHIKLLSLTSSGLVKEMQ